jgi:hypothetical protein
MTRNSTCIGKATLGREMPRNAGFHAFRAAFPIVRKRFMVTGDFTERELDNLKKSKA